MGAEARVRYPSDQRIRKVVEAARACGLDVAGVKVSPQGDVEVFSTRAIPKPVETTADEIAQWEEQGRL